VSRAPDTSGGATAATTVNGAPHPVDPGTTVAALVATWCPSPRGVAVAVDGEVVPRSTWESTVITVGAAVEIVTATAGG
jgi:sulfur carrier protein